MWRLGLGVCLLLGCALPATSHILKAAEAVENAERADAEKYALYELTKAREYLHKAREEYGYADYEVSVRLADEATEAADKALERARSAGSPASAPAAPK